MDEITKSKLKPDLAGSKENLPGQNQVGSLPLTCQVFFNLAGLVFKSFKLFDGGNPLWLPCSSIDNTQSFSLRRLGRGTKPTIH